MSPFRLTLRTQIVLGAIVLILCANTGVFLATFFTGAAELKEGLLKRQATAVQVLGKTAQKMLPELQYIDEAGKVMMRPIWPQVPEHIDTLLIDTVGSITGETATIFRWDAEQGDFLRVTTNIIKPDGERAIGTYLGIENPVHAKMVRGETYLGDAVILGNPYLTLYQPVFAADGSVTGILYVGIGRSELDNARRDLFMSALVVSMIFLIVSSVVAAFGVKFLLRPLRALSNDINRISDGDLDIEIKGVARRDEIGQIATSIQDFQQKLIQARIAETKDVERRKEQKFIIDTLSTALEQLADKNLQTALADPDDGPFPEVYMPLRRRFDRMVLGLTHALTTVREAAEETTNASGELAGAAEGLSTKVAEQAASLEQSAAAVQMMSDSSQDIARKATDVNTMSQHSRECASQGADLLKQAVTAMDDIVKSSQAITEIINVIDDIAFQTNILALNAGVEAQRSGTYGKGFAVVALEVGSLAQRVANSAQDIKTLVAQSRQQVDTGSDLIGRTSEAIYEALHQTDLVDASLAEIAEAVGNQSSGLSELSDGINNLDQATQRSALISHEVSEAGRILVSEAQRLLETIAEFSLRQAPVQAAPIEDDCDQDQLDAA